MNAHMTIVFISQIIIGLLIYGRGWWHGAFAPGKDNKVQLFMAVRGYQVNLTALGNVGLGLALVVIGISGLVVQ